METFIIMFWGYIWAYIFICSEMVGRRNGEDKVISNYNDFKPIIRHLGDGLFCYEGGVKQWLS